MRKKLFALTAAMCLALSLTACGDKSDEGSLPDTKKIELSKPDLSVITEYEVVTTESDRESDRDSDDSGKSSDSGEFKYETGKPEKNGFNSSTNRTESAFGYTFELPDYMGDKASNSTDDTYYYYAEVGGKVAFLMLQEFPIPNAKESDIEENSKNYMSGVKSSLSGYNNQQEDYVTVAGHKAYRNYFDCSMSGLDCNDVLYMFYDENTGKGLSIFWCESTNTEFSYFEDVEKIVDSFK